MFFKTFRRNELFIFSFANFFRILFFKVFFFKKSPLLLLRDKMTQYFVDFKNKTGFGQHLNFCVYQQMPDPPYSDSVAWLTSSLPGGAVSTVSWKFDKYLVALAHYIQKGK